MKTLTSEEIKKIQNRPSTKWHEGLFEITVFSLYSDNSDKLWAYWKEAESYIYHKKYSRHYWIVTKNYQKAVI